jgi:ATP synthase protein I
MIGENGAPDQSSKEPSFEERLRAASVRAGLDAPAAAPSAVDASALGFGLRVGVELLAALVVAIAIGWGLDRWLHTMPLFLIVFVLLGGAAGVANLWRMVAPGAAPRDKVGR